MATYGLNSYANILHGEQGSFVHNAYKRRSFSCKIQRWSGRQYVFLILSTRQETYWIQRKTHYARQTKRFHHQIKKQTDTTYGRKGAFKLKSWTHKEYRREKIYQQRFLTLGSSYVIRNFSRGCGC